MPMTKTFTENDLIQFLYNELNNKQREELLHALASDPDLQDRLNELRELQKDLDKVQSSPSDRTVSKILAYSKNFEVQSA